MLGLEEGAPAGKYIAHIELRIWMLFEAPRDDMMFFTASLRGLLGGGAGAGEVGQY